MAVRAVCADAGEDMPERAQKETRCTSAPWLGRGRSSRGDVSRKAGPAHLRDRLRRGSVQRVQGVAGGREFGCVAVFGDRSRRRRADRWNVYHLAGLAF